MKKQLTSLDLFYLVKELQGLVGARVQKVYQIEDIVYLNVYSTESKKQTIVLAPNRITVTEYEHDYPKTPAMFCMLLRKHLVNKRILSIKQHKFERIVEIEFADRILMVELFADGNVILVDKNIQEIIRPLKIQRWKARDVIPKRVYEYPPAGAHTSDLTKEEFIEIMRASDKDIVRTLATKLALGGVYAEEVIFRSDVQKDNLGSVLSDKALGIIFDRMKELLAQNLKPVSYAKKGIIAPFALKTLDETPKSFETMSKVVDSFFAETVVKRDKHDLLAHRLEEQKNTLKELKLAQINFKKEGDDLSQEQNFEAAGKAYDKVKKARKKEKGLKEAIVETEKELKKAQIVVKAPKKKVVVEKEWFEKFRWFKSSDGFLIIGGKDATTNEIIVKKHTEKGDAVFHAEIIGAPFCVVKAEGKKIPGKTLEEAAQFAAAYSKAWQQGLGTVDVFWVEPDQLSKEKGLPKGAFLVHGKHNYYRNVVLSIGFGMDKKGELIHGPVEMVKRMTKRYVEIGPGRVKAGELAKKIRNKLKFEGKAEEIQRFVPTGKGGLK